MDAGLGQFVDLDTKRVQGLVAERFNIQLRRKGKVLEGLKLVDSETVGFFDEGADAPGPTFPYRGYVSPTMKSPFLSQERQFNLMFRSQMGAVDVLGDIAQFVEENPGLDGPSLRKGIEALVQGDFLRHGLAPATPVREDRGAYHVPNTQAREANTLHRFIRMDTPLVPTGAKATLPNTCTRPCSRADYSAEVGGAIRSAYLHGA